MKCNTIDEVIARLNQIVEECKAKNDPLGYFAVLYRMVTLRVKSGILRNEFEDNQRMERLDVTFANRYFEAYDNYKLNQTISESWRTAFDATKEKGHIILQHLLLGINTHINLDLGIAALDTVGDQPINSIQKDFNDINAVLSELVDKVKRNIGNVSAVFNWMMPLADKLDDEMLINFSIHTARDGAWAFAVLLSEHKRSEQLILERDKTVAMLGRKLRNPGSRLNWILKSISLGEWRSVSTNISILEK